MTVIDHVIQANKTYAASHGGTDLPAPPARNLAIVTCMDARIVPLSVFGLAEGDAHILRNAGGRVTEDVLRSLLVSVHALEVRSVLVVHHTQCGMTKASDEQFAEVVTEATGRAPEGISFRAIGDPQADLRRDVVMLADSELLQGIDVRGYLYDIATGLLQEVAPAQR